MAGTDTKLKGKVLSASPTSSWLDEDNEQHKFDDVRLAIQNLAHGDEGAGRVSSGEIVLTVPSGDISAGDTFEATLSFKSPEPEEEIIDPPTLRQNPAEHERGRKGDGELGPEGKSGGRGSSGSSSSGSSSSGSSEPSATPASSKSGKSADK